MASYLIMQMGTGLVDGFYFDKDYAIEICNFWDRQHPGRKHIVVEHISGSCALEDEWCLDLIDLDFRYRTSAPDFDGKGAS